MHEKPDVIGVQSRKFALTSEIFHDDFHHGDILVFKKFERKISFHLIYVLGFDIRLIIVFIQVLCLVPLVPYIRNPGCICNNGR